MDDTELQELIIYAGTTAQIQAAIQAGTITENDLSISTDAPDFQEKLTEVQMNAVNSGITTQLVSLYSGHVADTTIHVTEQDKSTWNAKQDAINDLDGIRSGASAGATAVQPNDMATAISTHNTSSKAHTDIRGLITTETTNRENADIGLQSQIDAIVASSDVTDIVGTYAQLQAYDTSALPPNSIIKVLQDESQNDETTYYRWVINGGVGSWVLIGEEGPYYTKSEADGRFATASQGAKADTALQPSALNGYATETWVGQQGFLTSTALSGYATQQWVQNQGYITAINSAMIATALGYTPQQQLESGTNIKTVNGNSLLGEGDLVISGLPDQTGQSGKYLTTDGTDASWGTLNSLQNTASGQGALTILGTPATGENAVNIGNSTSATKLATISIGYNNSSTGDYAISIGESVTASGNQSIAIGRSAKAQNDYAIAIGFSARISNLEAIAIGHNSWARGYCSTAVGTGAETGVSNTQATAIGYKAKANANYAIQIGYGTNTEASTFYVGFNNTNYKLLDGTTGKIPDGRLPIAASVSSSSTNAEVVGAKLFYDTVGDIESTINAIRGV